MHGSNLGPLIWKRGSLNRWTTREVPEAAFFEAGGSFSFFWRLSWQGWPREVTCTFGFLWNTSWYFLPKGPQTMWCWNIQKWYLCFGHKAPVNCNVQFWAGTWDWRKEGITAIQQTSIGHLFSTKQGGGGSRGGDSESQSRSLPPSSLIAGVFNTQSQVDHCRESVTADDFIKEPCIQGKKAKN